MLRHDNGYSMVVGELRPSRSFDCGSGHRVDALCSVSSDPGKGPPKPSRARVKQDQGKDRSIFLVKKVKHLFGFDVRHRLGVVENKIEDLEATMAKIAEDL